MGCFRRSVPSSFCSGPYTLPHIPVYHLPRPAQALTASLHPTLTESPSLPALVLVRALTQAVSSSLFWAPSPHARACVEAFLTLLGSWYLSVGSFPAWIPHRDRNPFPSQCGCFSHSSWALTPHASQPTKEINKNLTAALICSPNVFRAELFRKRKENGKETSSKGKRMKKRKLSHCVLINKNNTWMSWYLAVLVHSDCYNKILQTS